MRSVAFQGRDAHLTDSGRIARFIVACRVAKYVKSNAIVFCKGGETLGVGAGQMSRVDSTNIAAIKAQNAGPSLVGSVVALDAFFRSAMAWMYWANAGARAVTQPGESMRDEEVIGAADEHGVAMVVTGCDNSGINISLGGRVC